MIPVSQAVMTRARQECKALDQLTNILQRCAALLHPKLRRLLNPNVIDSAIRLQLHFVNGLLNHIRDADESPAYVAGLKESEENPNAQQVLANCLRVLRGRLELRIGTADLCGVVILNVAISGGEATISSEADWVHKQSAK